MNIRDFYPSVSLFIEEHIAPLKEQYLANVPFFINACNDSNDKDYHRACNVPFCGWISAGKQWVPLADDFIDKLMIMVEEAEDMDFEPTMEEIVDSGNLYLMQALDNMSKHKINDDIS